MKKILLSAMALVAAMTVNAQEVGQISHEDLVSRLGLTTEKTADNKATYISIPAGSVFCESENVTMSAAFDDSYAPVEAVGPKIDDKNYITIKIGDLTIDAKQGVQGSANPKDAAGGNPAAASTTPAGGAVFQFDVKKDGYLYVFHKASSNKNYMAYEEKTPIGYIFTMATDGSKLLPTIFGYELKGEGEENYLPEGTAVAWPEKINLGNDEEDQKLNGLSVIKIPVFEGLVYWVNACGSKMTSCGYYFDETGDATITIDNGVNVLTLLDKGQIPGTEAPVQKVYSVIGTINGNWDADTDLVKGADGLYAASIEGLAAGKYEFKIRQDHDWTINWGSDFKQDGPNCEVEVAADGSTVNITFNPETGEIAWKVVGGEEPVGDETVLAEGSWTVNGWADQPSFLSDGGAELTAAGAEAGDIIRIYATAPDTNWQFELFDGHWHDNYQRFSEVALTNEDGSARASIIVPLSTQGYVDFEITAEFLTAATTAEGWGGAFLLNGDGNITVTKIALVKAGSTAINAVKAAKADGAIYNLAGQKVNASYKGVVIINGKKYLQK